MGKRGKKEISKKNSRKRHVVKKREKNLKKLEE